MKTVVALFFFMLTLNLVAQNNKYGLNPTGFAAYKKSIQTNHLKKML